MQRWRKGGPPADEAPKTEAVGETACQPKEDLTPAPESAPPASIANPFTAACHRAASAARSAATHLATSRPVECALSALKSARKSKASALAWGTALLIVTLTLTSSAKPTRTVAATGPGAARFCGAPVESQSKGELRALTEAVTGLSNAVTGLTAQLSKAPCKHASIVDQVLAMAGADLRGE